MRYSEKEKEREREYRQMTELLAVKIHNLELSTGQHNNTITVNRNVIWPAGFVVSTLFTYFANVSKNKLKIIASTGPHRRHSV